MGDKLRPVAIFGLGLYLGLAFFKNGQKRESSGYLKDLKENFDRTSGVLPPSGNDRR